MGMQPLCMLLVLMTFASCSMAQMAPPPPENVTAVAINTTSFMVTWDILSEDDNITFNMNVSSDESVDETLENVPSGITIDQKTPGDRYEVIVFSLLDGLSTSSTPTYIRLLPESVETFSVGEVTTSSVELMWTMKPICESDCVWTSFRVDYGSMSSYIPSDSLSTNIISLIPGETYDFTITVISFEKSSVPTNVGQRTIPESVATFTVGEVTTSSVELMWTMKPICKSACVWTSFRVDYGSMYSNISSDDLSTTITSLIPGETYDFTITVISYEESSLPTTVGQRTIPESVETFTVGEVTTSSVELMWTMKPICESACFWTSFRVDYGSMYSNVSSDDLSTTITSLIPGETYDFTITVISYEESSLPTTVEQRTIPESVETLSVGEVTTSSVELMWTIKPICESDCIWTSFRVNYGSMSSNIPSNNLSTTITSLIPGETYDFTITVISFEKSSLPTTVGQRTIPESVETFNVGEVTTSSVELMWTMKQICESDCVWTSFRVDYGSMSSNISSNNLSTTITSLIPGETYDFTITVISFEKSSVPTTVGQRTIPESVKTLSVVDYNSENVTLIWEIKDKCANERCVWSGYTVKYNSSEGNDSGECMSDKNDTSIDILDLIPGSLYDFIIYVVSDKEQSSEEPASQRLRPASVTSANSTIRQNSITVEWDAPRGYVTSYRTNITDNNKLSDPMEVNTTWVEFDGLIAFSDYTVTICSKSYEEECENIYELNIQTLPDVSSAPQDLVLRSESITSVIVAFKTPEFPNGDISGYKISYNGKREELRDDDNLEIVLSEDVGVYSVLIRDLLPGFLYEFMVVAVNQGGDGEPATENIKLGQEAPETPRRTESPVANIIQTAHKSFTVEFSPTVFSHCNGEINNYTVIVVESGAYNSETDEPISDTGSPPPTKTFSEVSNQKPMGEYQAFAPKPYPYPWSIEDCKAGSSRRRRQTTMLEVITIGDGNSSGGYTNGELHSNRAYRVKFRVMNEVGYADSIYSAEIKTELYTAAWLVPLLFGLFLILLILIILIILKERREPGSVRRRMPWVNGGIENPAFVEDKPMRRTGDKRPVKLANFGNHLEEMEKDSDYLFSEEYNDLRPVGKNQADDTAKLDCNKSKNRFSNILPYDHTRVKLSPAEDEPGSDYINANYMVGAKSSREYIACQGPLQNTEEDMWRMVWEQGASLIVMVTQLMEGNKIKCHQYWCQEGEGPVRYGDIIVKNVATEQNDLWVVRKFSLTRGPVSREVLHFNFTAWPDHGVPESPDYLIKFVQAVRRVKKTDGKPIVVHCSAGVGRTGTFIALDTLMSQMESSDEVDIFGLIRSMRMNRCLMVQTEIQYVYIHQCIMALLEGDDENAYENYNGTTDPYYNEALI